MQHAAERICIAVLILSFVLLPTLSSAGDNKWTALRAEGGYATQFVADGSHVYLRSGSRIYVSDDGGNSWSLVAQLPSSVSDLAVDGDVLMAATQYHGVQRSVDGGVSWSTAGLDAPHWVDDTAVTSIEISNDAEGRIYAGTLGDGVYVSTDGGTTWTPATGTPGDGKVAEIAVNPANPTEVYAGMYGDGLYRSIDGGANWEQLVQPISMVSTIVFVPGTPQWMYIGGFSSADVQVSKDGGTWWTSVGGGLPTHTATLRDIAFDADNSDNMFAVFDSRGDYAPLYLSTDRGMTWTEAAKPNAAKEGPDSLGVHVLADGSLLVGSTRGVFKVSADGSSWGFANSGFDNVPVHKLAVAGGGSDRMFVVGRNMYPYRSDDNGATWTESANTLAHADFYTIELNPVNSNEAWLGQALDEGLLKTTDGGSTWTAQALGASFSAVEQIAINPLDPNNVIALENDGVAYVTNDGGVNWQAYTNGLPASNPAAYRLVMHPVDPQTAYVASSHGLFKSTNGGQDWAEINVTGTAGTSIMDIAISPDDPDTMYAGTFRSVMYRSEDGGGTWRSLPGSPNVRRIAIDPRDGSRLLVSHDYGIEASMDGGVTWSDFTGDITPSGVGNFRATDLQFDPDVADRYYAVMNEVLYVYDGTLPSSYTAPDDDSPSGGGSGGGGSDGSPEPSGGGGGGAASFALLALLGVATRRKRFR